MLSSRLATAGVARQSLAAMSSSSPLLLRTPLILRPSSTAAAQLSLLRPLSSLSSARPLTLPLPSSSATYLLTSRRLRSDKKPDPQPDVDSDKPLERKTESDLSYIPNDNASPPPNTPTGGQDASTTEPENIPFDKLPDLTRGIPSEFEYEASQRARQTLSSERKPDHDQDYDGAAHRQDSRSNPAEDEERELPDSAYVSSNDRKRQKLLKYFMITVGAGALASLGLLGRELDGELADKHADIASSWTVGGWVARVRARVGNVKENLEEPAFKKLLPEPTEQMWRPYTIVVALEDLLVHSEWDRQHGWRVAKRPGVDYFLRYLNQYAEIVVFSSSPMGIAEGIVKKLDPWQIAPWKLFREATNYKNGEFVKDLSYLNRDLSKVIVIDTDPAAVQAQPENAILLPKWKGDPKDLELVALVPFLESITALGTSDVRKVLKSFEGKHIPSEYARREAALEESFRRRHAAKTRSSSASSGFSAVTSALGLKASTMAAQPQPAGEQTLQEILAEGKMPLEYIRQRGRKTYEHLEQQIRENQDAWAAEEAAQIAAMQAEMMKSVKGSLFGWIPFLKKKEDDSNEGSLTEAAVVEGEAKESTA